MASQAGRKMSWPGDVDTVGQLTFLFASIYLCITGAVQNCLRPFLPDRSFNLLGGGNIHLLGAEGYHVVVRLQNLQAIAAQLPIFADEKDLHTQSLVAVEAASLERSAIGFPPRHYR